MISNPVTIHNAAPPFGHILTPLSESCQSPSFIFPLHFTRNFFVFFSLYRAWCHILYKPNYSPTNQHIHSLVCTNRPSLQPCYQPLLALFSASLSHSLLFSQSPPTVP